MSKQQISVLFLLMCLYSLSSCVQTKTAPKVQKVEIDSLIIEDSFRYKDDTSNALNRISMNIQYPRSIEGVNDISGICSIIASSMADSIASNTTIKDVANLMTQNFKKMSLESCEGLGTDFVSLLKYPTEEIDRLTIHGCVNNIFSFDYESMIGMMGAAHPNTTILYRAVDLNTNSILKTSDFISESNISAVSRLIKEQLAIYFDCDSAKLYDFLLVTDVAPNDNFIITQEGITWLYNRYEIAPYVAGAPSAFIPFSSLSFYINEDSPLHSFVNE